MFKKMPYSNSINKIHCAKSEKYFELIRKAVAELVPSNTKRVLDIGCGQGNLGEYLKTIRGIKYVAGFEIIQYQAQIAETKLDKVYIGNAEELEVDIPKNYFDCIICADVLEHMIDPWGFLYRIRDYLTNNGTMVASLPNIRHARIIIDLLCGKWDYQPSGLLDKGHLRFFTKRTIADMFNEAGFQIVLWKTISSKTIKSKLAELLTFGLLKPFTIQQFLLIAKKMRVKTSD